MAVFFPILGIAFDIMMEELFVTWFGLVISLVCLIAYALQKNLAFGFETSGGAYYGMSFKRGVLNNVSVDITQVENALLLVNALIGSASLKMDYSLSSGVQKVASKTTILATPPPAQQVQATQSQVYTQTESHTPAPAVHAAPTEVNPPPTNPDGSPPPGGM